MELSPEQSRKFGNLARRIPTHGPLPESSLRAADLISRAAYDINLCALFNKSGGADRFNLVDTHGEIVARF